MTADGGDAGLAVQPVVPLLAGQTYSQPGSRLPGKSRIIFASA